MLLGTHECCVSPSLLLGAAPPMPPSPPEASTGGEHVQGGVPGNRAQGCREVQGNTREEALSLGLGLGPGQGMARMVVVVVVVCVWCVVVRQGTGGGFPLVRDAHEQGVAAPGQ